MRPRHLLLLLANTLSFALWTREAHARIDLRAQLEASVAADDSPPVAGNYEIYFDLRPQLALTEVGPRHALRVGYTLLAGLHPFRSNEDTLGNRLELSGLFSLSQRNTFLLTGSLLETSLAGLTLVTPTATTTGVAAPLGTAYFVEARARAEIATEVNPLWRFSLASTFDTLRPLNSDVASLLTTSYDVDSTLSFERSFQHDAGALRLRGDFIDYPVHHGAVALPDGTIDANGVISPQREIFLGGITTRWRRDYGRSLSSELEAGALAVVDLATPDKKATLVAIVPVGVAALHYVEPGYQVNLSLSRQVQSNVFLGQTFVVNSVALMGSLPIPGAVAHFVAAASLAYQHETLVDQPGVIDAWLVDTSLFWIVRDDLQLFFRYQLIDQLADATVATPLPSVVRNVVMLGLIGTFSTEKGAPVSFTPAVRADRTDGGALR